MLSFSKDDFIKDYIESKPSWMVTLNNGQDVYQDDGRYEPFNSWTRLYYYCLNNNLYITNMQIGFRNNIKQLKPNKDGYYFCNIARGVFGIKKTFQLFLVGFLENEKLFLTKWKVPEMLMDTTEIRYPENTFTCLIRKPNE